MIEMEANKPDVVKAITIEVTTEQAQKLTLAATVGTLSLALRDVSNVELTPVKPISIKDLGITEAIGTVEPKPEDKKAEKPVVKIVPKPAKKDTLPSIGITRGTARQEYKVTPEGTVVQPPETSAPARKEADQVPAAPALPNSVSLPTAAATSF